MLNKSVGNLLPAEMARKDECPYDCGGYFIVRGNEKVGIVFVVNFNV